MVSILLDDGMQNGHKKKQKNYFINSLVRGHPHKHTVSKYGLGCAWLGSVQKLLGFTIPFFDFIHID